MGKTKKECVAMEYPDGKGNFKTDYKEFFKMKYIDILLMLLVVIVFGVLLAVSASAQPLTGFPTETPQGGLPMTTGSTPDQNSLPVIAGLVPDKPSPQGAGTTITWTAKAFDPDGDTVSYKFQLMGPSTGSIWKNVTDWSSDDSWDWTAASSDVGQSQIRVLARDGNHAGPNGYDAMQVESYEITAPVQTAPAQTAPVQPQSTIASPEPGSVQMPGQTLTQPPTQQMQLPTQIQQPTQTLQIPTQTQTSGNVQKDTPPVVNSLIPSPMSPMTAGVAVTWTADATDPDGDQILYRFFLSGPSTGSVSKPQTGWTTDNTWTWTTSEADIGENQVEVWVRDGKNANENSFDDRKSASFTISAPTLAPAPTPVAPVNKPPVIGSLIPDNSSPQVAGTTIAWTSQASDPDNDPIQYRFFLDNKPETDWSSNPSWTWTTSTADIGSHSIQVSARDGKHNPNGDDSKTAQFTIVAPPNKPPVVNGLKPDKQSPQVAGTTITWTADAADPDNDPIQYRFFLDNQPQADWSSNPSWIWTTSAADVGSHSIEVRVRDGKHNPDGDDSKTSQFTIIAPPNKPPVVNSLTSDKQSPQGAGTVINWTANATDPDNDPIQYRFFLDNQPQADWSSNPSWTWTTSTADIGSHSIEISVRDGKHNPNGDDSKTSQFTIIAPPNKPPVVNSLKSDKSSPQAAGTAISWTSQASDPDNDPIQYRFLLDNQPATDWSGNPSWTWNTSTADIGSHSIEISVRDGKHNPNGDDSKTSQFTIIAPPNKPPVVNSLTSDKQSPQGAGTVINWTANATDPDNDPIQYRFFLDNKPEMDWSGNPSWTWMTSTADIGSHSIQVSVRDGKHNPNGDDSKTAQFTIAAPPNRPPVVNSLTSDKQSPQVVGTTVTWTAVAADPDNDPIQYRFFLNGTPATDWITDNKWIWATTNASIGDNQIEVSVRDGKHNPNGDDSKTAQFTIAAPPNKPPVLNSLSSDKPGPQAAGTNITWTANAIDPDGDQILYRYFLNGQPMTGWDADNTWTWNTTAANVGNNQVEVRVRDGQHAGVSGFDDHKTMGYTITAPAPKPPVIKPAVTPVNITPVQNVTPTRNVTPAKNITPTGNVTPPAPAKVNSPPVLNSLISDKQSPQVAGTVINWTANATDPDGDQILYKFFLKGPSTKGQSVGKTGWTTDNTWTWNTTDADVGSNQIEVWARDGTHANENSFDSNKIGTFAITARPAPVPAVKNVTPVKNVTTPVNVTSPANVTPSINATPSRNITPQANVTKPAVSPVENNTPPALRSLTPDKSSPQLSGTSIVWTANATDPDGDQILYRFFLNGTSTSGSWKPETDWAASNTWTWTASSADVGQNQIRVWVRDGKHANANSFDSEQVAYFTITAPTKNISGVKFNDLNGNGVKDANEPGLADWRITLTKPDGSQVGTLTGADGSYKFEGLTPGSYTVSETAQTGWSATAPAGGSQKITLGNSDITDANFGNKASAFSISGRKFNDLNGNGVNDGEPGLAGWKIQLARDGNVINTTTTGADGSYTFEGLANGAYTLSEVLQTGWTQTAPKSGPQSVTVQDKDVTGIDFGNKVSATYSISGMKFNDLNGNGARDGNESGLAGWKIQLAQGSSVINGTSTAADGSYKFTGLAPGSYTVSEELQSGWAQTEPKSGSYSVNLVDKDVSGMDFGNKGNVTISSKKFFDINKNGIQDPGEPGIPGLTVHLQENGQDIATTTTGSDGSYTFNGLLPGTYTVVDPVPSGFVVTTSSTVTVTVTSTTTVISNANFGIIGPYAISGMKFNDLNGNGVKDAGEPGISGWGIVLTGTTWFHFPLPSQTVNTAADGSYTFSGLLPGTYTVSEVSRTGWTQTAPSGGSYTVTFNFGAPPSTATGKDFGNRLLTPPGTGSISGVKFNDLNGNGINNGDPGLAGWTIQLKNATNNTVVRTATTDAYGGYSFINLQPGNYVVGEVTKTGWTQTAPSGGSYSILLHSGESKIGIDFGNYNPPPINPTLTPSPSSPRPAGVPITWTATATDPNGDPLQYRFFIRAPGGALLKDTNYITSNTWVWNTAGLFPGTYQAEVWIRDGYHASPNSYDIRTTSSFTLTPGNRPPEVDFLFADRPSPQFAGSWVKWTTVAHDPDGDQIQYRYLLRGPSTFGFWEDQTGWTPNNRWIWRTTGFDVGPSEVLVLVRDGHHAGPNGWDDYDVAGYSILAVNTPPVITSLATNVPSPEPVGAAVQWKANAFDPDGDLLFYRYWVKGPSTGGLWKLARDWSTDSTWTWLTTPADVGITLVDAQVRDGFHAGPQGWDDDASALFTILRPNLPPQLTGLVPDKPSPQYAGVPVKWTALATDPDNDPVLYRFWLKGPTTGNTWKVVQDWSYSNTWIWASAPSDTGDYSVYVYARDGYHAGPGGYDSALGQRYTLQNPLAIRMLTAGAALKNKPSLVFTGDGYLLAYQSFALGPSYQGDIYLERYDPTWNKLRSVWASNDTAYEGSPSVIFANGYYYVAYASRQTGVLNIFLKRFDANLNYIDTKQLTDSVTDQDSPSLLRVGNQFFMAYQSWDTGSQNGGDIFITRFDQNWNPIANVQVTNLISYQDHPSIVFASGSFYVAYTSNETGNKNIFVRSYDPNLNLLNTRRMTYDSSDHDYPSLNWINGQFLLLYDSNKAVTYDVYLDRYLRDWTPIDSTVAVAAPGDQMSSSMAYSTFDGMYWVAYASADPTGQNIYVKPLTLAMPSQLKPCDIVPSFSSTRANSPYTLTLRFYNDYGELTDPMDLSFIPPQDSARPTDQLQRISLGTLQFSSVFGAPGDKTFKIGANIDGCISAKVVPVKVT